VDQDGRPEQEKHVTEVTHLMSRAGKRAAGLRWIVRRAKPSRRQAGNLTAFEKKTGWRYSIICANIPMTGIPGVLGSHHPQFIDVLHRQHAVVEDGVRNGKAMGLRNLPSKAWQVNCGWVLAASIAADLAAWTRLIGLHDQEGLSDAEPQTLRYRLLHLPARLASHARQRTLKISPAWPWKDAFLTCWERLRALPAPTRPAQLPYGKGGGPPRRGRSRRCPAPPGSPPCPRKTATRHHSLNQAPAQSVTSLARLLNHRG
jgi:hypothetical protein